MTRLLLVLFLLSQALVIAEDIYQGSKGGCYTIKVSRKTGKEYRKYVPCPK